MCNYINSQSPKVTRTITLSMFYTRYKLSSICCSCIEIPGEMFQLSIRYSKVHCKYSKAQVGFSKLPRRVARNVREMLLGSNNFLLGKLQH